MEAVCPSSEAVEVVFDLAGFHAGRVDVVHRIYVQHGAALLRSVRAIAGPAEAEAVVHDVFVDLLRNAEMRARFSGGALLAWLRQIARLKSLEHLRRVRRHIPNELADVGLSPEGDLEARDVLQRFLAAAVPERQREFFGLRFVERHTQAEIAARLGIARSTLEGWEHALVDRLRTFILEEGS
jgi:RNA polymerase sigma factor (sigma-70 family)